MTAKSKDGDKDGTNWVKWAGVVGAAIALFVAYRLLPIGDWVTSFQNWVQGYGTIGWLIFILVYAVTAFVLVPGSFLTLAAGAVWGIAGFILVIFGATLGSMISFLAARYMFHDKVQNKVEGYPKFRAVNEAIRDEGWKVVGLMRLSPALPFSLQNWFLGVTPVKFWPSQIATFFGIMPGTLLYILIGSAGGTAAGGSDMGFVKWVVLGVGIVATLLVTVIVTRKAQAKLKEFENK